MKTEISNPMTPIITAWVFTLLVGGLPGGSLPKIILQEIFDYQVSSNLEIGIAAVIVVAGLGLTFAWNAVRSLRPLFILLLVLMGAGWLVYARISALPIYEGWLADPSPNVVILAWVSRPLVVALAIIATMFILKKRRDAFFLVKGDTSAPLEPVRWLGIKAGATWNKAGRTSAIVLSLGTLTFLILAGRPSLDIVVRALPFLPVILLASAVNAFSEEMFAKASFLSVLEDVVGKHQALWLMASAFGIGHFYGIPYGVVGVLMAGFLGWWLGKSMLETRGLWWAWFIHFMQDLWIFAFAVVGSIVPGGG
ncbi:MAG: CPBP family intramembrane metalloprotease [Chloroflexi bacterium]|nr:CPBP family intramembrane metalloprotease [Chloroflexota bacterium]